MGMFLFRHLPFALRLYTTHFHKNFAFPFLTRTFGICNTRDDTPPALEKNIPRHFFNSVGKHVKPLNMLLQLHLVSQTLASKTNIKKHTNSVNGRL